MAVITECVSRDVTMNVLCVTNVMCVYQLSVSSGDTCDMCHMAVTSEHVSPGVAMKVIHLTSVTWL